MKRDLFSKRQTQLEELAEALAEENDSDNDDGEGYNEWNLKSRASKSTFELAPASFSLLPRITPTPATTPLRFHGEIDPDL